MPELSVQELDLDPTSDVEDPTVDLDKFQDFEREDLLHYLMYNPAVLYDLQCGEADATVRYDNLITLIQSLSWTIETQANGKPKKGAEPEFDDERYQGHLENLILVLMQDLNFLVQFIVANEMSVLEGEMTPIRKLLARKNFQKILLEYFIHHEHFKQAHHYTSESEINSYCDIYSYVPDGMRSTMQQYMIEASARIYGPPPTEET